jgi:predicted 3-demethylubiquinone-9 3-methyltransferase (glyoxalase superfamily)
VTGIHPFLWFNDDAEQALDLYQRVFADSEVVSVSRVPFADLPNGQLVIGTLRIQNLEIMLFNGGPHHSFTESISLYVNCEDQAEVDHYWDALVEGGRADRCGWLKDPFGVSWQIVPRLLGELMSDPDAERAGRVRDAMMGMIKLDCAGLQAAYDG